MSLTSSGWTPWTPTSKIAFCPASRIALLDLLLGLAHHLLDARRMDAAVRDQPLQGNAGDLAADRIVTRDDHRLRRVVDDQVDARSRLDGADVSTLAADDPPLHVVAGQVHDRDRALRHELARQPLDRDADDLLGLAVRLLARLLLDLPNPLGRLVTRFVDHLLD